MPLLDDQSLDSSADDVFYPESDGAPMGENPYQAEVILTVKLGFQRLFGGRPDVWVGADNFWYPVEGKPKIVTAPDTMVVVGLAELPNVRAMGSYRPWDHGGRVALAVEVLSPSNTVAEMHRKHQFYDRHGVDEYWVFDPDSGRFEVSVRSEGVLRRVVVPVDGFVSPTTGVRVRVVGDELAVCDPNSDRRWLTPFEELTQAERGAARAEQEAFRAEQETARAEAAEQRVRELEARLAALEAADSD
jgi:Uma2 family endonuclease